jgi:GGDEF domain-containing protein
MRRTRLNMFISDVLRRPLPAHASVAEVYSLFAGIWSNKEGEAIERHSLIRTLEEVKRIRAVVRSGASAFFPIPTLEAVVSVRCGANYREKTIKAIFETITSSIEFAGYQYEATHTVLTGLVNKQEFTRRLTAAVGREVVTPSPKDSAQLLQSDSPSISVIGIDLDNFKH